MEYYFTTKEVSQLLRISVQRVRTLIKRGNIKAYKPSREYIIREQDLNNYLDSVCSNGK